MRARMGIAVVYVKKLLIKRKIPIHIFFSCVSAARADDNPAVGVVDGDGKNIVLKLYDR